MSLHAIRGTSNLVNKWKCESWDFLGEKNPKIPYFSLKNPKIPYLRAILGFLGKLTWQHCSIQPSAEAQNTTTLVLS